MDKWIFWSHHKNGWHWAVFVGAKVIAEGDCESEAEANKIANEAMQ